MRQVASKLNKTKILVDLEKAQDMYRVCNGRAYRAIYKLYDKGYIRKASEIEGKSLNKVIFQNFKGYHQLLLSELDGTLMLTKERFLYAKLTMENKIKEGVASEMEKSEMEDFRDFCSVIYDYLEAREDCTALHKLLHLPTVSKQGNIAEINPKVYISNSTVKSSIPFSSKAVRECLVRPEKTEIKCYPLVQVVIEDLAVEYGLGEKALASQKATGNGIFFTDLSKEAEYQLFSLVVTGDLQVPTILGASVFNGVLKRYKEASEDTSNKLGICSFKDLTYFTAFEDECKAIQTETAKVVEAGGDVVGLSQNFVYYVVPSENEENWYTDTVKFSQEDMGFLALDWVSEDEYSMLNVLYGACGEYVPMKQLASLPKKYTPVGEPIKMQFFKKKGTKENTEYALDYVKVYSILDLVDEEGKMPEPKIGNVLDFAYESLDDSEHVIKHSRDISPDVKGVAKNELRKLLYMDATPELHDIATDVAMYMLLSDMGYASTDILTENHVDVTGLNKLSASQVTEVMLHAMIAYEQYSRQYRSLF